jgi:hypothetical protein
MKKLLAVLAIALCGIAFAGVDQTWLNADLEYHMKGSDRGTILTYSFRNMYEWDDTRWNRRENEFNALIPWKEISSNLYWIAHAEQEDNFHTVGQGTQTFKPGVGMKYAFPWGFSQEVLFEAQLREGQTDEGQFIFKSEYELQGWIQGEPFVGYWAYLDGIGRDDIEFNEQRMKLGWGFDAWSINIYAQYMYWLRKGATEWDGDNVVIVGFRGRF